MACRTLQLRRIIAGPSVKTRGERDIYEQRWQRPGPAGRRRS